VAAKRKLAMVAPINWAMIYGMTSLAENFLDAQRAMVTAGFR
jgi:hypothetical protein